MLRTVCRHRDSQESSGVTRLLAQLKRLVALHLSVQKPADTTGSFLIEVHPLRTALRARRRSQLAGSSGSAGSRCERHHQLLPASCCERSQRCERERGRSQRGWEHEGVPLAARCGWQRAARGRCERRGACPSQRCWQRDGPLAAALRTRSKAAERRVSDQTVLYNR